jgi:hypothetical protein
MLACWMLAEQRADGIMPQMCPPDNVSAGGGAPPGQCSYGQYCNDTVGAPGWQGCQDLDSAAFAVKFAHHIWSHGTAASALYARWGAALARSIRATTVSPTGSGLLWSNTTRPMIGCG